MKFKMAVLGLALTAALTTAALGMLKAAGERLSKNARPA